MTLACFTHAVHGDPVYVNPAHVAAVYVVKEVAEDKPRQFTEVLLSCGQAMPVKERLSRVMNGLQAPHA